METQSNLILKQMAIGPMDNFEYFIGDKSTGEVAVIDPAWDVDFLLKEAEKNNYTIVMVILTHGHPDHINGVDELLSTHDVPVFVPKHENGIHFEKSGNIKKVDDGDKIKIGDIEVECIHTPGHTRGGQCLKSGDILIAGDTVFIDGCGRCDLPGGDARTMYDTLYNIIMKLPDETVIYPGHNYGPCPFATLASQKTTNPYFKCQSKDEFLQRRMGLAI